MVPACPVPEDQDVLGYVGALCTIKVCSLSWSSCHAGRQNLSSSVLVYAKQHARDCDAYDRAGRDASEGLRRMYGVGLRNMQVLSLDTSRRQRRTYPCARSPELEQFNGDLALNNITFSVSIQACASVNL